MSHRKSYELNAAGVKFACDCYRTFNGEHYTAWMSFPSKVRIAAYRKAGVKCRRLGEELFVRESDRDAAAEIDARFN